MADYYGTKTGILASQDSDNVTITGGTISGVTMPSEDDATLSGAPKLFVLYDGATPYYVKAYPTKS